MTSWRSRLRAVAVLGAAVLGLASCTNTVSSGSSSTFTMQFAGVPVSLNPALGGNGESAVYVALAYDPLIYLTNEGKLVPDLATSWKYVGTDNTTFQLTLRKGVTFTDGSPVTAEAVVASMRYFLDAGGGLVSNVGDVAKVETAGPMTVRIHYGTPNPDAARTLTQYNGMGLIIGPDGLAHPKSLLTKTDGTGQYIYDTSTSVAGSHYDYVRNPDYFNPDAQQFEKVTVRVINDPQAVLSAVQTGQVSFAGGAAGTVEAAKSADLKVLSAPFFNWNLILADAKGTVAKPLGDQRVRHAIALALNRRGIAKAFGGKYHSPSDQVMLPGTDGYIEHFGYVYNLHKARSLMAAAGYPDGFSLTVLTESILDPNTKYSQVIANALKPIGIRVKLHVDSTSVPQFIGDAASKKFGAVIWPSAGSDMFAMYSQISTGVFNPFELGDAELTSILQRAFASSGAERTHLYQQAERRYNELAWLVPVFSEASLFYVAPNVSRASSSIANPNPMPVGPTAALSWTTS